jgi:hypothetical protein
LKLLGDKLKKPSSDPVQPPGAVTFNDGIKTTSQTMDALCLALVESFKDNQLLDSERLDALNGDRGIQKAIVCTLLSPAPEATREPTDHVPVIPGDGGWGGGNQMGTIATKTAVVEGGGIAALFDGEIHEDAITHVIDRLVPNRRLRGAQTTARSWDSLRRKFSNLRSRVGAALSSVANSLSYDMLKPSIMILATALAGFVGAVLGRGGQTLLTQCMQQQGGDDPTKPGRMSSESKLGCVIRHMKPEVRQHGPAVVTAFLGLLAGCLGMTYFRGVEVGTSASPMDCQIVNQAIQMIRRAKIDPFTVGQERKNVFAMAGKQMFDDSARAAASSGSAVGKIKNSLINNRISEGLMTAVFGGQARLATSDFVLSTVEALAKAVCAHNAPPPPAVGSRALVMGDADE